MGLKAAARSSRTSSSRFRAIAELPRLSSVRGPRGDRREWRQCRADCRNPRADGIDLLPESKRTELLAIVDILTGDFTGTTAIPAVLDRIAHGDTASLLQAIGLITHSQALAGAARLAGQAGAGAKAEAGGGGAPRVWKRRLLLPTNWQRTMLLAGPEREVTGSLEGQGVTVTNQVTPTDGTTVCRADCALAGQPGEAVQVPPGYVAEDPSGNTLVDGNGNPISSFNLNSSGQAVVEVKTGNANLTSNQVAVYPEVQTGGATGVGGNATDAGMSGSIPETPTIVLRKR